VPRSALRDKLEVEMAAKLIYVKGNDQQEGSQDEGSDGWMSGMCTRH
jgi:hypothetical protein